MLAFIGSGFQWIFLAILALATLRVVAQLNQKSLGAIVAGIGVLGVMYALTMDTSNNGFVNIGLMQEQRNLLEMFSLAVVAGIVVYGFAVLASTRAGASAGKNTATCPKCNGLLDGAPELCKYCRTELRWNGGKAFTVEQASSLSPMWEEARRAKETEEEAARKVRARREAAWRAFCRTAGMGIRTNLLRMAPRRDAARQTVSVPGPAALPFAESIPPQDEGTPNGPPSSSTASRF
jgi:hypothetical protein